MGVSVHRPPRVEILVSLVSLFPRDQSPSSGFVFPSLLPGRQIRQVWNVIEGQQSGVSVFIFDSYLAKVKGTYCTFIACQTEKNVFGIDTSKYRVIQSGGWAALYRVPFLQILPWTMSIQRLDDHVNRLRVGSSARASC